MAGMSQAGRPRPLRADAARNRQRVLNIAQAVFASDGLAVPIDVIARRAGLGVGTLYRHFPTKEALFAAIMVDRMDRLVAEARALADARDPGDAFFGFLARLLDEGAAKKDLADALAGSGFEPNIAPYRRRARAAIRVLVARAQKAGAVRRDVDVDEVLALVKGTFVAVAARGGGARARRRLLAILCDGLRAGRVTRGA
jgi:AcrR family transcriptional regulator